MTRRGTATVVLALVGFSGAAAVSPPVSATVSGPAPAIGAVDQTYTDASGVIHYVFDPASLPGAVPVAQEGDRAASGACRFTGEDVGQAGADGPRITVMRELSFDPATCSRELAVASYTADTVPAGYAAELRDVVGSTATESASTAGDGTSPQVVVYIGRLKVNVEDPAQIDVTSTKSDIDWSGGSCVTSSSHAAHWGWYSPSGWQRTNAWWAYDRSCSRAYTNTYGKYKNTKFCLTIDTHSEHRKTWFEGRPYGRWYWAYDVEKWGGCSGLLHYEYLVTTP
jgi:hypothetical protein